MIRGRWEEVSDGMTRGLLGKGLYLECPEDGRKRHLPGMIRGLLGKGLYLECPKDGGKRPLPGMTGPEVYREKGFPWNVQRMAERGLYLE